MSIDLRGTIADPPRPLRDDELERVSTLLRAIFLALRETSPHARTVRTALRKLRVPKDVVAAADEVADVLSVLEGLVDGYRVARGDLVELTYDGSAEDLIRRLRTDDEEHHAIEAADSTLLGDGANTRPFGLVQPPPLPRPTAAPAKPKRAAKKKPIAKKRHKRASR